jgi:hypothetical protein
VRSRSLRLLAIVLVHLGISAHVARAADPKVPAGRDPGGIAVAIIGGGLDYRRAALASRLARDGEGELVSWDFVDSDRHPFAESGGVDAVAALIVGASQARLVPVRVAAGSEPQIAQALRMLDETPARVVLLAAVAAPIARGNLVLAARQLSRMLIVVPARIVAQGPAAAPAEDAAGLLVVSASGDARSADLVVEPDVPSTATEAAHPDDVAAARVVALAARLAALEPTSTGSPLRARILAMAQARANGIKVLSGIDRLP